jgi:exonuclease III
MRIVSWNMRRRSVEPWDYLINTLDADIALIQEYSHLPETVDGSKVIHQTIKNRNFGNAIYAKTGKLTEIPIDTAQGGAFLVGLIEIPAGDSLVLINLYGLLEAHPSNPTRQVVHAGIHRALSDLTFLLQGWTKPKFVNFVLAGDLNNDRRMDNHPRFRRKDKATGRIMFERIENYGLHDCVSEFYPDHVQTYRHNRGGYPWQLDHMFASKKILARLKNLYIDDSEQVKQISDHNPIVADFDIL